MLGAGVEAPSVHRERARHAVLRRRAVEESQVLEAVAADRDPHARIDRERLDEIFAVVGVGGTELIAVLQVDAKVAARLARLELVLRIGDVLQAVLEMVLPDCLPAGRARAEPEPAEGTAERAAAHEADLRVEVVP